MKVPRDPWWTVLGLDRFLAYPSLRLLHAASIHLDKSRRSSCSLTRGRTADPPVPRQSADPTHSRHPHGFRRPLLGDQPHSTTTHAAAYEQSKMKSTGSARVSSAHERTLRHRARAGARPSTVARPSAGVATLPVSASTTDAGELGRGASRARTRPAHASRPSESASARGHGQRSRARVRSGGGRGCATAGKQGPQLSTGSHARQRTRVRGGAGEHASQYPSVCRCWWFPPNGKVVVSSSLVSRAEVVSPRGIRFLNFCSLSSSFRPCLVLQKFCKIFQIPRHIESLDVCMKY
ncbi:hypothetical protein SORBI_3004G058050 [Sorghum bicolor]|uniref:Uncharacterized protein n=1 Tax=Sorghum bicolor TaxID=4558 RepID=C5XW56_SORBI|nr:hypothetical protein SORBI_3004G058050 [Sorghum bicolor]